jgi:hypothetical protein
MSAQILLPAVLAGIPLWFFSLLSVGAVTEPVPPPSPAHTERMEYDITWVGVSVGSMSVWEEVAEEGTLFRSIRIWNRPWIAAIYPVDNTVECRISVTPDGPLHVVSKKMGEKDFLQDDTLLIWPEMGKAIWTNAVSNVVHAFDVPLHSRDFVTFFFDLRDAAKDNGLAWQEDYQLVMDGSIHGLSITRGETKRLKTPFGAMSAIPVKAISKSPELFSRNRPKAVWVAEQKPAVLFADVHSRFGTVRATLTRWEINGRPVEW